MITKDEWEKVYEALSVLHWQFYLKYNSYQKGETPELRMEAEVAARGLIRAASNIIFANTEIFDILVRSENFKGHADATVIDSFERIDGFDNEISMLLFKIQRKIKSFE